MEVLYEAPMVNECGKARPRRSSGGAILRSQYGCLGEAHDQVRYPAWHRERDVVADVPCQTGTAVVFDASDCSTLFVRLRTVLARSHTPTDGRPSQHHGSYAGTRCSGSNGSERSRTPVAWKRALPIAGAIPIMGVSPAPADGRSLRLSSTVSMGGTSANRGIGSGKNGRKRCSHRRNRPPRTARRRGLE